MKILPIHLSPGDGIMNEPVSATTMTAGSITGATIISYVSGIPVPVIIASFAGAVVYVLSNSDIPIFKRLCFFMVSFFVGILGADYATRIIEGLTSTFLQKPVVVDISIGAFIASAVAIKLTLSLIDKVKVPDLPGGRT